MIFIFFIMALMVFLVLITFMQVFYRYILNSPLIWSEELARYTFIWIVFLSAWYVFKKGGHLGIDFLTNKIPQQYQIWVGRAIDIIILLFLIIVLINAPSFLRLTYRQTSAALKIPMLYIYLAFPLSCFLMLVEILLGLLNPKRKSPGEVNIEKT